MRFIANGSYCMMVVPTCVLTNNYAEPNRNIDIQNQNTIDIDLNKINLNIEFIAYYSEGKMSVRGAVGKESSRFLKPIVEMTLEHNFDKHNAPIFLHGYITWKTFPKLYLYIMSEKYRDFVQKNNLWYL